MLPNICPPVDRNEKAQQRASRRGPEQAYRGGVSESGIACDLCKRACNRLPFGSGICKRICDRTACRIPF